jgi:hypothetical protein
MIDHIRKVVGIRLLWIAFFISPRELRRCFFEAFNDFENYAYPRALGRTWGVRTSTWAFTPAGSHHAFAMRDAMAAAAREYRKTLPPGEESI